MSINYEDRHLFAAWSPNMATALWAINKIGCAHLLRQIVPDRGGGFWLVFKADSWLKARWKEHLPDAELKEVANFDLKITKAEKHRRRLIAAIKAGVKHLWPDIE